MSGGSQRHLFLDGVRGLAALAVLLNHIGVVTHRSSIFDFGYLAVDVFFVMSGYVMANAYEQRMATAKRPILYMLRTRVIRLWPMILVGAVLGLIAAPVTNPGLSGWALALAFMRQLTFIPTLRPGSDLFLLNGLEWSLLFELLINLVHAAWLRRLGTAGVAAVVAVGALGCITTIWTFGTLGVGWSYDNLLGGFARVGFAYPLGLLAWRLRFQPPDVRGALARAAEISGEISYPLYAIQGPILWLWERDVIHRLNGPVAKAVAWIAVVPALCALSWSLGKWYDAPVRRWLSGARVARFRTVNMPAP